MKEILKVFISYLKFHIASVIVFIIGVAICLGIFYLYNLPLEPFFYAVAMLLVLIGILGIIGFIRFNLKHKLLKSLTQDVNVIVDNLPKMETITDEDLYEIIYFLERSLKDVNTQKEKLLFQMIQYYTLWVHQIKTPIAAMDLILQSDNLEKEELKEQLFKIEQYAHMALQYSRSQSMHKDYVFKKYELDEIIKQAVRKYSKSFIRKKIKLVYKEANEKVLTDEKWLLFVIEQLISNALKYTNNGEIRIYYEDALIIEDSGIGIEKEDLPRIFNEGFTGFNGRAHKKSTGIGLYLCKKILVNLSSKIEVFSEVNVGTQVKITFSKNDIAPD